MESHILSRHFFVPTPDPRRVVASADNSLLRLIALTSSHFASEHLRAAHKTTNHVSKALCPLADPSDCFCQQCHYQPPLGGGPLGT